MQTITITKEIIVKDCPIFKINIKCVKEIKQEAGGEVKFVNSGRWNAILEGLVSRS